MTDITWLKEKLSQECNRVRTDKTYTGIVEDNRMDAFIIDAVMEKMARVYGFTNFSMMHRFMTPDTKVEGVVYVGHERRKPEEKGTTR